MDREADNRIIGRILKGERDLYSHLIDRYKGPIFNLAYRMTGQREEANDLAQETFVRAYENLVKFNGRKQFFTWLYTISLNIIRNNLKRKGRVVFETIDDSNETKADNEKSPEKKIEEREAIERLEYSLKRLSFEQKEAVVLRCYQGLSFQDIAEITDVSLSTAKMRVYRGLEKLRDYMKD
jgi:RNA polymerase sigma-70 factor (ECF subfamily)